ncbi:hypothetical protein EV672_102122 [Aquabacterium commune]|uniref:Uncharacterized protein n=1 Tax=Aquabacterium commune TaxID=70586 RepID=A0A4R6RHA7_9BURK|nr:hypothetical protein [Aquabacterium commune]TDP85773.1 hypothetical protein EV672_102122 [Aquabacterium commune]
MSPTVTAMLPTLRAGFDRPVRRALLGVQCRDVADGRVVSDGLQLVLYDLWQPRPTRQARVLNTNRSGVFALHDVPGIRSFLTPSEADSDAALALDDLGSPASPDLPRFRLTVHDTLNRYVDMALTPTLGQGLWGPLGDGLPHVPLYSAATRTPPIGMASLRTELRSATHPEQAIAWAHLRLMLNGVALAEGLSDAAGRVLMVFPLPRPREGLPQGSPATAAALLDWPVTLQAFWSPERRADLAQGHVPDLDGLLAQAPVPLLQHAAPPTPLGTLTLRAGQTLLVASPPSSFLFVAD